MRKFSRRTMLVVVTGVLLTAGIAFAVSEVTGTGTFQVQAEDVDAPIKDLKITVERVVRPNLPADTPISETQHVPFDVTVENLNDEPVTLGADPVTFEASSDDPDCTTEDLEFRPPDFLANQTIPANSSIEDRVRVRLAEGSGEECDNATFDITLTVTGSIDDGTPAPPAPVEGSGQL